MSAFDKIIGYKSIKDELIQISDMIHNREIYKEIGARLPQGVLLYGEPGLGKSLMAKCLIEECGIKTYTIRRNKGNDDFVGEITDSFRAAAESAPAIVFLDDMDKFANEDNDHPDCEEYVAVQAGIDEVKNAEVFVFATVNDIHKLPDSLVRAGRFDKKICVKKPTDEDAAKIIEFYLSGKKTADDISMDDLSKMISYSSCAELETVLNEAAISAAFKRKKEIGMDDLTEAVLRMVYDSPNKYYEKSKEELKRTAIHEAGHTVAAEVLCPGSIGLVSMRATGREDTDGFTHRCKELPRRTYDIIVSLAGKAAVEMYYSETCASGCKGDLERAVADLRNAISGSGTCGLGLINISVDEWSNPSPKRCSGIESAIQTELERYMFVTRNLLLQNRGFLEQIAQALEEKETLLFSDIQAIRGANEIVPVAV